ncbi:zeta-carotene desaturase [Prunus dulcis]|uniref:Zeta-carotene desaturase n=1 Tax=Prunus dulcis TaxID=3755 RepID=A0A4Y1RSD4_PRUDU|nr:zeta-carotene desaturase [Prunus dulcis]
MSLQKGCFHLDTTELPSKVAIIGAGLAGMSTVIELLDQGHESSDCSQKLAAQDYKECTKATNTTDELSLV